MKILSLDGLPRALAFVLWGSLALTMDVWFGRTTSLNGGPPVGFRIDIINDFVGALFVLVGLRRVRRTATGMLWSVAFGFLLLVAFLQCGAAFLDHVVFEEPPALQAALRALGWSKTVAVLVFLVAMERLARTARLPLAARRWRRVWVGDLVLTSLIHGLGLVFHGSVSEPSDALIAGATAVAISVLVGYGILFIMAFFAASAMRPRANALTTDMRAPSAPPVLPTNP